MSKLVSIVLPTYNGEDFLRDSIESVINQTYQNWELIIVNDASVDSTLEIAKEYEQKDSRIRVISNEKNLKLPASLNVGFDNAKGDYYTWTSDDNMFKPNALEVMVKYLDENPGYDLVYSEYDCIDEDGKYLTTYLNKKPDNLVNLLEGVGIGACFMYTREIAQKTGKYDENFFLVEDLDFFIRVVLKGKALYLSENLYTYRMNSKSLTATRQNEIMPKIQLVWQKYSLDIMNKMHFSNKDKVQKFFEYYTKSDDSAWIEKAKSVSLFLTYWYIQKPLLKKLFFNLSFKFSIMLPILLNKKIMFWGASLFLQEYLQKYPIRSKKILGIIDKDSTKWGKDFCGYKIYSPDSLSELKPDLIIFSIKNSHSKIYNSVKKYLKEYVPGVKLSKDFFDVTDMKSLKNRNTREQWSNLYNPEFFQQMITDIKNDNWTCQSAEILNIVEENACTLEIGCGTAMSSFMLAIKKNANISVLDFSKDILNQVRNSAQHLGVQVQTACCDAFKETPFSKKQFDVIFHSGLLEHFNKQERIAFLKRWNPYCKKMVSMVPNAASIAYRTGKAIKEKEGTWQYGLEMPLYSQVEDFISAGYENIQEYTIGEDDSLTFLEYSDPLRQQILDWRKNRLTEDDCHQGYLLVTIGEPVSDIDVDYKKLYLETKEKYEHLKSVIDTSTLNSEKL